MTVTVAFDLSVAAVNAFNAFAAKQWANIQTALSSGINSSTTSITVDSVSGMAASDSKGVITALLIDSEVVTVSSISGTTLTVTRAALGTTAASHSSGAMVQVLRYAGHHRYLLALALDGYKAVISSNDSTYAAALAAAAADLEIVKESAVS